MNISQLRKCRKKTCAFTGEAKVCIIRIQQQAKPPSKPAWRVKFILKDHFQQSESLARGVKLKI